MKRKNISIVALCLVLAVSFGMVFATAEEGVSAGPVAENLEITTYREVSVGGRLKAVDPDGDILTFEITTAPTKGTIELGENGSFVYTPAQGKKGRDYFGYKAFDCEGNSSSEATVIIRIEKQKTNVCYTDMSGNGAYYAAIALAEKNIFIGEQLGGEYVFNPDAPVTRGEFLTMCLKLNDFRILSGVITTGFADDDEIPGYQKPYVSTAMLTGVVSGYSDGLHSAVFSSNNYISYSEAAVMLNRSMSLTDVNSESYGDTAPAWAAQACANLSACRITDYSTAASGDTLSRADCAKLMCEAMRVLDNR